MENDPYNSENIEKEIEVNIFSDTNQMPVIVVWLEKQDYTLSILGSQPQYEIVP